MSAEANDRSARMKRLVIVGPGTIVDPTCVLGKEPLAGSDGASDLCIGVDGNIRPFTTLYAGSSIGDRFQTGQGVTIREGNTIGDDVSIGTNSVLEKGNHIGNRVRIHTGCFLELVTLEDDVFIAPHVVFADDPHPPCTRYGECLGGAIVRRGARIGSNSTILPGVIVGRESLVGAGSVVVHDVPDGAVVAGSPARVIKRVDELICHTGLKDKPYAPLPASEAAHPGGVMMLDG